MKFLKKKTFLIEAITLFLVLVPCCNGQATKFVLPCDIVSPVESTNKNNFTDFSKCDARIPRFSSKNPSIPEPGFRTNGISNFCIVVNPNASESGTGNYSAPKSRGDQFKILELLAEYDAWSNQPLDDLPFSLGDIENNLYNESYPENNAPNPYFVEVSRISLKKEILHGFLHFRIFLNRSESLGKHQGDRYQELHTKEEHPDNARGSISAALIMVKDQNGWPIGDFTQDIPCRRSCGEYPQETYYGDKTNALPCSFTPPRATSHPGMFVFDVQPGYYGNDTFSNQRPGIVHTTAATPAIPVTTPPAATTTPLEGGAAAAPTAVLTTVETILPTTEESFAESYPVPELSRSNGIRELHATWNFNQDSCNFASKIYIQTLILEEVRNPIVSPDVDPKNKRLYGWTAQYNILKPTRESLGAADYVNLPYLREREKRGFDINCHVPMFDAPDIPPENAKGFRKGQVPSHKNKEYVPTIQQYMFALRGDLGGKNDLTTQYYGQHQPIKEADLKCNGYFDRDDTINHVDPTDKKKDPKMKKVSDYMKESSSQGVRCPCPQQPTEEPAEDRTVDPARLHGRLIHASHMAIAYMLLTPLACFVARYYKETFVTVFCFQEYWWFMWHVVFLMIACVFNFGAVLSITLKNHGELKASSNLLAHKILGGMSIFVFYMEIFTGFFRAADPKKRMRQIFMHWFIGVLNNVCAVGSMFAMAWVESSGMSCATVYSVLIWLIFVIIFYVIMEMDMRRTDKKMRLKPKRTYLPPPVVRRFNQDAPGKDFRMLMLALFIIGLILLQLLVSYNIWNSGEVGNSCHQEYLLGLEEEKIIGEQDDEGPEEDPNNDDNEDAN